jgi:hypothetical protein
MDGGDFDHLFVMNGVVVLFLIQRMLDAPECEKLVRPRRQEPRLGLGLPGRRSPRVVHGAAVPSSRHHRRRRKTRRSYPVLVDRIIQQMPVKD